MREELLGAVRQAEGSEPAVTAAALLRIARVFTKVEQIEAERLLERALTLLAQLPGEEREAILTQATCLAACVSPARAFELSATDTEPLDRHRFLIDMVHHGHVAAAVDYLTRWSAPGGFPYGAAIEVMACAKDDSLRRDMLRSGIRAWRGQADHTWHSLRSMLRLFRFHWRLLPPDELYDELERMVNVIRTLPDTHLSGSFGGAHGKVTFSSYRPSILFELLGPLRRLNPALADVVISESTELARAADRYPYGSETDMNRPTTPLTDEALAQWKHDWKGFALGGQFFRIADEQRTDFRDSFDRARRSFAADTNPSHPNTFPRDCWPSAEDFRTILYAAGRYEGHSGTRLLERVPDPALRQFAHIELLAGVLGLPQIGGITRSQLR